MPTYATVQRRRNRIPGGTYHLPIRSNAHLGALLEGLRASVEHITQDVPPAGSWLLEQALELTLARLKREPMLAYRLLRGHD